MTSNTFQNQELLKNVPFFKPLSHEELGNIIEAPENSLVEFDAKQVIVRESEIADCMYVILEGTAEVYLRLEGGDRQLSVATLRKGDFFGEQAILPGGPGVRNASVRSLHPSKMFKIDKKYVIKYANLHDDSELNTVSDVDSKHHEMHQLLSKMRLFQTVSETEFKNLSTWAKIETYESGQFVFREFQDGDSIYIVLDGLVEIFILDSTGKIVIFARLNRGRYFGEQALLPGGDSKRNSYARADSKSRLIRIDRSFFEIILNRDHKLLEALKKIGDSQGSEINRIKSN